MPLIERITYTTGKGPLGFPDGTDLRLSGAFFALTVASLVIESLLFYAMLLGLAPLAVLFLLHLLVSGALAAGLSTLIRRKQSVRMAALLTIAVTFLGPFGIPGVALTFLLHRWQMRHAVPFELWYKSLFPAEENDNALDLYRQIQEGRLGADSEFNTVVPFSDVMNLGTVQQKQAAIILIADHFKPAFMPALRQALHDREPSVRVQAATAVARLEKRYVSRLLALEGPGRAVGASIDAVAALARQIDDYANSGLLDERRAQEMRLGALTLYRRVAKTRKDEEAIKICGRLMLRLGLDEAAAEWFADLPEPLASQPGVLAWRLESLYRLNRFEALRELARTRRQELLQASDLSESVRSAIGLWSDTELLEVLHAPA